MKSFVFLSATATILTLSIIDADAQTSFKSTPDVEQPATVQGFKIDTPRIFHRVDSSTYLVESGKFVKKPNYTEYNQPVTLPNSFKSAQAIPNPMPVKKIPLAVPEDKKD